MKLKIIASFILCGMCFETGIAIMLIDPSKSDIAFLCGLGSSGAFLAGLSWVNQLNKSK